MKYDVPTIQLLGEAVNAIQGSKVQGCCDGVCDAEGHQFTDGLLPAYELDE